MRDAHAGTRWAVLAAVAVAMGCSAPPASTTDEEAPAARENPMELVEITNGTIVLGALPSLGGRVVLLKAAGGENLLDSDPRYWKAPFPPPSLATPFAPWNGRIVWVGPQSGFWSQQDLVSERAGAPWPPDPFNEAGRFEIVEQTSSRLRLRGEASPVTGLALEHDYEITGERTVRMAVTATNERDTPVSWDLWPNTRVRPDGFPYVPLGPGEESLRVDVPDDSSTTTGAYPHVVVEGWLAVPPGVEPEPPRRRLTVKAFVRPSPGLIAYFREGQLLLIRADEVPVENLHPNQAFIEIYRGAGEDPEDNILELEMHGPYRTLGPRESMSFEQAFEVLDYDGSATQADHLARLADLLP